MTEIYLDNSATTRCFDKVSSIMMKVMCEDYGNPSSLHTKGFQAEEYIRKAKKRIASTIKTEEKEIYFTSGGTEADHLALVGTAMANCRKGKHLITTAVEHPAVAETMNWLESEGFEVTRLPVDKMGRISLCHLENALRRDTILVSIMHTNNEIGSFMPIAEAGSIIKRACPGALFHVDAVQGYGKAKIHPKKLGIDLMSVSGHKIHGPKGIGFLYVNEKVKIQPVIRGGGQQRGVRSGTENVPAIAGLGVAAEMIYQYLDKEVEQLYRLKEIFVEGVCRLENVHVNGYTGYDSAPHIISVTVGGVRSEVLLHALEDRGIFVSAGSACAARKPLPSVTLKAMGMEKETLESTIRVSLSVFTTREEIDYTLKALYDMIPMLRKYTRH